MNLLRFIELQGRNTVLHRTPIPIKTIPFVLSVVIWVGNFGKTGLVLHMGIALLCCLMICLILRSPRYALEIFIAFLIVYMLGGAIYLIHGATFISYIRQKIGWFIYLLSMAYSLALLLSTTSVEQLEEFLRRLRLPEGAVISITIAYNLIPAIYFETKEIIRTQRARGLEFSRNPIRYIRQALAIYLPLIFVSLIRARNLEGALKARGYE